MPERSSPRGDGLHIDALLRAATVQQRRVERWHRDLDGLGRPFGSILSEACSTRARLAVRIRGVGWRVGTVVADGTDAIVLREHATDTPTASVAAIGAITAIEAEPGWTPSRRADQITSEADADRPDLEDLIAEHTAGRPARITTSDGWQAVMFMCGVDAGVVTGRRHGRHTFIPVREVVLVEPDAVVGEPRHEPPAATFASRRQPSVERSALPTTSG